MTEALEAIAKVQAAIKAEESLQEFGACIICGAPYTSAEGPCKNGHTLAEEVAYAQEKGL